MLKNLLKNKRGDIPITIFVIGVLAICILAIFSFYSSSKSVKDDFSSLSAIEKVLITKEKISFYNESLEFTQEQMKEIFGIKDDLDFQVKYITAEEGPLLVRYNLPK
jgi:hypothetical protein